MSILNTISARIAKDVEDAKARFQNAYRAELNAQAKLRAAQSNVDHAKATLYEARLRLRRLGVSEDQSWDRRRD